MKRTRLTSLIGLLLILLFIAGIIQLFSLRFTAGDVYPYYSSLREDPLGVKAYYESLEKYGLSVRRNYRSVSHWKDQTDATMFFLGVNALEIRMVPESLIRELDYFISNGGRLVVSLLPPNFKLEDLKALERTISKGATGSLVEHWGFTLAIDDLPEDGERAYATWLPGQVWDNPVLCETPLYFDKLDPAWRPVLLREGRAVLMERRWGKGSIVMSAPSYYFSNEAMVQERHPGLLAWLIGDHRQVVFDEYHLGIASHPGVASLARKYKLQWLAAVLFLLAVLFIWKNAVPFIPAEEENVVLEKAGRESTAGLANLLRRNIRSADLLSVCFEEWKRSITKEAAKQKLNRIEQIVESERSKPPRQRNVVAAYQSICRILKERSSIT